MRSEIGGFVTLHLPDGVFRGDPPARWTQSPKVQGQKLTLGSWVAYRA
jgi:hypothetical protein